MNVAQTYYYQPIHGTAIILSTDTNDQSGTFNLHGGLYGRRFQLQAALCARMTATSGGNIQTQWQLCRRPIGKARHYVMAAASK